jgi:protein-tyrosine phosphatase
MQLGPWAKELGIGLALGTEYHVDTHIVEALDSGRCRTLAGSRYVLCEYSESSEYSDLSTMTQELILHGYVPIIAHVERYRCIVDDPEGAGRLREMGAWIQLNADAVLGMEGIATRRFCKKMLKAAYVDVIASDSHGVDKRACHLDKCYRALAKKYGEAYAERLFYQNPAKIIAEVLAGR